MEEENEINAKYLTYNGLNRPAMIFGVPIMIFLFLGGFSLFSALIGLKFIGIYALLPSGISIILMIIIRSLTENDSNALPLVILKIKGFFMKKMKLICVRGNK